MAFALVVHSELSASSRPTTSSTRRSSRRQERIRADLPDALDLLAVSVEAGLGFDAASSKLIEQLEGPLIDEFALTLYEMRVGESPTGGPERSCPIVRESARSAPSRAAIDPGRPLRYLARAHPPRPGCRHPSPPAVAAEEKAMKAPVKMLFPTVSSSSRRCSSSCSARRSSRSPVSSAAGRPRGKRPVSLERRGETAGSRAPPKPQRVSRSQNCTGAKPSLAATGERVPGRRRG